MQGVSFCVSEACERAIKFFTVQEGYSTTSGFVRAAINRYLNRDTLEYCGAYETRYGEERKHKQICLHIEEELYEFIHDSCENEGMTLANFFRDAVALYIWELEEKDNSERAFVKALRRLTYISANWRRDPDEFLRELRGQKYLKGLCGDKREIIKALAAEIASDICAYGR